MSSPTRTRLTGICAAARGAAVAELARARPAPAWLVVTDDANEAERIAEDLAFFLSAGQGSPVPETLVFPESIPDSRDMREAFAASSDRLAVLSRLRAAKTSPLVVVTTPVSCDVPGTDRLPFISTVS